MLKCLLWFPVEFPESYQDVVKVNDMMTFKVVGSIADEAAGRLITKNPVVVTL